ncbi:partitioning defective 3 homolog isoform X2 [Physella acuta]|uniref:partitioning defective 3 homolog isoform X2 n=1 Tax=Physella acuta TaxID=109671 RepID=UPI0027DCF18A|nr:partitioning defective 3 homolog isoform X2 [Physella acuta]
MPIKVIVCFDTVRVTVPCGEGSIPVRELINKAVHRYKRAVGKGSNHWVEVISLKTISGGGILDPDDQLCDVVDDREQLIAEFKEHERPFIQHNGGDGASASSTGTISPDIFHAASVPPLSVYPLPRHNSSSSNNAATDVIITPRDLSQGMTNLHVRRGSEPNLNLLIEEQLHDYVNGANKPLITRRESIRDSDEPVSESSDEDKIMKATMHGSLDRKKLHQNHFTRDALHTSLNNQPEMFRWLEAQEKVEQSHTQLQVKQRVGPIKGHDGNVCQAFQNKSNLIHLENDGGPLGIHAVPAYDENGKDIGLLIQSIEPNRPVHKDGRIQPDDIVTEINGTSLQGVPFLRAQEIFRTAMDSKEICLQVVKGKNETLSAFKDPMKQKPPPVLPKPRSHTPMKPSPLALSSGDSKVKANNPIPAPRDISKVFSDSEQLISSPQLTDLIISDQSTNSSASLKNPNKVSVPSNSSPLPFLKPAIQPFQQAKRVPPVLPTRSPSTALSSTDTPLNALTNTRRIGKKLVIYLTKGPLGLGFSVTSRDNQTDGNCPIYIRNILPKGAAVQDGQLRPGDRLLQVNGVEMTGKTQKEAVSFLRQIPEGGQVVLIVSRQEEVDEKFKVPRKLGDNSLDAKDGDHIISYALDNCVTDGELSVLPLQHSHQEEEIDKSYDAANKEKITLHIPLNESGSAGLGVSVKGRTETFQTGSKDLGIYVKTVLQGGAAFKDGRLQVNDQLLEVNGVKLDCLANTSAMEALRLAMLEDGQVPGCITLTVSRHKSITLPQEDSADNSNKDINTQTMYLGSYSDSGHILHQRSSSASDYTFPKTFGADKDLPSPIPPTRLRKVSGLMENFTGNGLRNESYMKATHDSLNDSTSFTKDVPPTNSTHFQERLMLYPNGKDNALHRPHSTIGFMHNPRNSPSDEEGACLAPTSSKEEDNLSPNDDLLLPFAREGFGRQSMSEKRKGHLDPRSTEIYKLAKAGKENKGTSNLQTATAEPVVNILKRSSSEECLASARHYMEENNSSKFQKNEEASEKWKSSRLSRGRACNDSFRAAVDRSYDPLDPSLMDTLEEESAESGAFTLEPSHSGRSSISSEPNEENSSLKRQRDKEKKGSLFKGFLRFGKGRKSNEEAIRRSRSEERSGTRALEISDFKSDRPSKDRWIAHNIDNERITDLTFVTNVNLQQRDNTTGIEEKRRIEMKYKSFLDGQGRQQFTPTADSIHSLHADIGLASSPTQYQPYIYHQWPQVENSDPRNIHPAASLQAHRAINQEYKEKNSYYDSSAPSKEVQSTSDLSRAEYIQKLRSLYQQRHRQRQGVYPLDDTEEHYEKQIQELEHTWSTESSFDEGTHNSTMPFSSRPASAREISKKHTSLVNVNNSSSMYSNSLPKFSQQYGNNSTYVGNTHSGNNNHSPYHFTMKTSQSSHIKYPPQHSYKAFENSSTSNFEEYVRTDGQFFYRPRYNHQIHTGISKNYNSHSTQYSHKKSLPYSESGSAKV